MIALIIFSWFSVIILDLAAIIIIWEFYGRMHDKYIKKEKKDEQH